MRWYLVLLYLGLLAFLGSSVAILGIIESGTLESGEGWLLGIAAVGLFLAGVLIVLSVWLSSRRVDWKRIEAEQRLWESGPLGRTWLKVRRRLYNLWKL